MSMKIRGGKISLDDLLPEEAKDRVQITDQPAEIRRVLKRIRTLFEPHFSSAERMEIALGPDDLLAVIDALLAESEGLSPQPHLECAEELRKYLRSAMFDDLVGEPSNVLYTTQVNEGVVRYDAMPVDFWRKCLIALREQLTSAS